MKIRSLLLVLPLAMLCPLHSYGQGHTERGAVIGGLGGALAGAAIGKHNGETAAGALIGGAVGVVGRVAVNRNPTATGRVPGPPLGPYTPSPDVRCLLSGPGPCGATLATHGACLQRMFCSR